MCVEGAAHDFPAWQTVYYYLALFRRTGVWEQLNQTINQAVRKKAGRKPKPAP